MTNCQPTRQHTSVKSYTNEQAYHKLPNKNHLNQLTTYMPSF